MIVKCISNMNVEETLQIGKEYAAIEKDKDAYAIELTKDRRGIYKKYRFEIVKFKDTDEEVDYILGDTKPTGRFRKLANTITKIQRGE